MESDDRRWPEHRPDYEEPCRESEDLVWESEVSSEESHSSPPVSSPRTVPKSISFLKWGLTGIVGVLVASPVVYSFFPSSEQEEPELQNDKRESPRNIREESYSVQSSNNLSRKIYYRTGDENIVRYLEDTNAVQDGIPDRKVETFVEDGKKYTFHYECSSNDLKFAKDLKVHIFR
jgi:hypothetical protein